MIKWMKSKFRDYQHARASAQNISRPQAEKLEPRILFSADLPWTNTELGMDQGDHFEQHSQQLVETTDQTNAPEQQTQDLQTLIVLDASLFENPEIRSEEIFSAFETNDIEFAVLDSLSSGYSQLSGIIENQNQLGALQVITAGGAEGIALGDTYFDVDQVLNQANDIATWRSQLDKDAAIDVYVQGEAPIAEAQHLTDLLESLVGGEASISGFADFDALSGQLIEQALAARQQWEATQSGATTTATTEQTDQAQQIAADEVRREVVFVDSRVHDYQTLVDEIAASADDSVVYDVYLLDADQDGLAQISVALAGYEGLDAIHLVSHGDDSSFQLGNTWISGDNISNYFQELQGWSDSLDEDADLLVYGCDLASSEAGVNLLTQLQTLTGADVAASDDKTGHQLLDGDWQLEYQAGVIETDVAVDDQIQEQWMGLLAINDIPVAVSDELVGMQDTPTISTPQIMTLTRKVMPFLS